MEAVTLAMTQPQAVGNEVQQGDRVTVYSSGTFSRIKRGQEISESGAEVVVPDALILKVTDPDPSDDSPERLLLITLALTPRDAESVLAARVENDVWLGLLPPGVEASPTPTPTPSPTTT
jgi:Flp pilus assembly protein CpaB